MGSWDFFKLWAVGVPLTDQLFAATRRDAVGGAPRRLRRDVRPYSPENDEVSCPHISRPRTLYHRDGWVDRPRAMGV